MANKTTTKPASTDDASAVQAPSNEPAINPQRVRILRHGVEAAGLICAAGAVITVSTEVAAALIEDGAAKRIY